MIKDHPRGMRMFFAHQDYPTISLDSFKGFEEGANAARIFERRFQPAILDGVAVAILGFGIFSLLALRSGG